jgi:hypothetical protein
MDAGRTMNLHLNDISRKFEKKVVRKESKAYEARLQDEINKDREDHGKKPIPPDKFIKEELKEIKESTTDLESGYYVKDKRTKQFAYSFHVAADRNGFVLGAIVTHQDISMIAKFLSLY